MRQEELERLYNAQQTEAGSAGIKAQRELSKKLQEKGINVKPLEVACLEHIRTGEKKYYMKG